MIIFTRLRFVQMLITIGYKWLDDNLTNEPFDKELTEDAIINIIFLLLVLLLYMSVCVCVYILYLR